MDKEWHEDGNFAENAVFTSGLVNALSQAITDTLLAHPINTARKEKGQTHTNMVTLRGCG